MSAMFWGRLGVCISIALISKHLSDTWTSGWVFACIAYIIDDAMKGAA